MYVAVAPTYPECDESDLRATLTQVAALEPATIFHEPINIRAENVERISSQAQAAHATLRTDVFETRARWRLYALESMESMVRISSELGLGRKLHLWPDKSLGSKEEAVAERRDPVRYEEWLRGWWEKVSAWPK